MADAQGQIEFQAHNGGIHLARLAGNAKGETQNGGLHIELAGDRWNGQGLDVHSVNGGVHLSLPTNYSARLEAATTNGRISSDIPELATPNEKRPKQIAGCYSGKPTFLRSAFTRGSPRSNASSGKVSILPIRNFQRDAISASSWAEGAFGTWKLNPARSKLLEDTAKTLTVRFEPHAKGEVFTMDTIHGEGQAATFSTILYFDGKPRAFQGPECSGTQSSWRVDSRTVEILNKCVSGEWTRFVRRLAAQPNELILEVTEQHPDGRRVERRLVLEKQY